MEYFLNKQVEKTDVLGGTLYGFVQFVENESASRAIKEYNGKVLDEGLEVRHRNRSIFALNFISISFSKNNVI